MCCYNGSDAIYVHIVSCSVWKIWNFMPHVLVPSSFFSLLFVDVPASHLIILLHFFLTGIRRVCVCACRHADDMIVRNGMISEMSRCACFVLLNSGRLFVIFSRS